MNVMKMIERMTKYAKANKAIVGTALLTVVVFAAAIQVA
jgi:hypothetical protein